MIVAKFKELGSDDSTDSCYGILVDEFRCISETEEDSTGVICLCCLGYFPKENIRISRLFNGISLEELIYQEYEKE